LKNVLNCSLKAKQNLSFQILKLQQLHCDLKLCIESQKQEKSMTKKKRSMMNNGLFLKNGTKKIAIFLSKIII
jgi:hypothetical protein